MTRFKTVQEVWDNLADCDRRERQMGLYGPYDPRSEEVMEGWRSSEYAPRVRTADEWREEARIHREIAFTSSISWSDYCELAAKHAESGRDFAIEVADHWSDEIKAEWRACIEANESNGLIRNRHLLKLKDGK